MIFEGYYQHICEQGHRYEQELMNDAKKCPHCNSPSAWSNLVDTTNGTEEYDEDLGKMVRIDGFIDLEIDQPAKEKKCVVYNCLHVDIISHTTYKIPAKVKKETNESNS